jgi:hypothetical protein
MYLYAIAACVVVVLAWFALLFTGRWPRGMYDFVAGFLRYSTYVNGYMWLATDRYPPFSGDAGAGYPVRLNVAPPQEHYSRAKVFFRFVLAIPVLIIVYAMQIVAQIGALLAWFAIVLLGRQPKGLQDMIVLGVSYQQRASAYVMLVTEDWPPFTDDGDVARVETAPSFGELQGSPPASAGGGAITPGAEGAERPPDPFGRP